MDGTITLSLDTRVNPRSHGASAGRYKKTFILQVPYNPYLTSDVESRIGWLKTSGDEALKLDCVRAFNKDLKKVGNIENPLNKKKAMALLEVAKGSNKKLASEAYFGLMYGAADDNILKLMIQLSKSNIDKAEIGLFAINNAHVENAATISVLFKGLELNNVSAKEAINHWAERVAERGFSEQTESADQQFVTKLRTYLQNYSSDEEWFKELKILSRVIERQI